MRDCLCPFCCHLLSMPPCLHASPSCLCVSAPPTHLDECVIFKSLAVGLPYSSIFWQFWVLLVLRFSCNSFCGCMRRWSISILYLHLDWELLNILYTFFVVHTLFPLLHSHPTLVASWGVPSWLRQEKLSPCLQFYIICWYHHKMDIYSTVDRLYSGVTQKGSDEWKTSSG